MLAKDAHLSIPRYVKRNGRNGGDGDIAELKELWAEFETEGGAFWSEMNSLVDMLDSVAVEEARNA